MLVVYFSKMVADQVPPPTTNSPAVSRALSSSPLWAEGRPQALRKLPGGPRHRCSGAGPGSLLGWDTAWLWQMHPGRLQQAGRRRLPSFVSLTSQEIVVKRQHHTGS